MKKVLITRAIRSRPSYGIASRAVINFEENVDVDVESRAKLCSLFYARVRVNGIIAFSYSYRLRHDLSLPFLFKIVRVRNRRALARLFGWRDIDEIEAAVLTELFLSRERDKLMNKSNVMHVEAAARAGYLDRISNQLAITHALSIMKYVKGQNLRRLMAFEIFSETGKDAPYHWADFVNTEISSLPEGIYTDPI
jgi:hypothetical protein